MVGNSQCIGKCEAAQFNNAELDFNQMNGTYGRLRLPVDLLVFGAAL
jgi:hypothetical protein